MKELDVVGYEGIYKVRSDGSIYSFYRNKFLTQHKTKCGYLMAVLCKDKTKKTVLAHRIVGTAFLGVPELKMDINHINGIKTDNRVENLEWCTRKENIQHSYKLGLSPTKNLPKYPKGDNHMNNKPILKICPKTNKVLKEYVSISKATEEGHKASTLSMCLRGSNKTSGGFIWKYKN